MKSTSTLECHTAAPKSGKDKKKCFLYSSRPFNLKYLVHLYTDKTIKITIVTTPHIPISCKCLITPISAKPVSFSKERIDFNQIVDQVEGSR